MYKCEQRVYIYFLLYTLILQFALVNINKKKYCIKVKLFHWVNTFFYLKTKTKTTNSIIVH